MPKRTKFDFFLEILNEGASRIHGYSRDEALRGMRVINLYPEGEARRIKKQICGNRYGRQGRLINYETQALTRSGRLAPILLSAALICKGNEEAAAVGYFKDLQEIKQLQNELLPR